MVYKYTQTETFCQYGDTQMNTSERLKRIMEVKGFNLKTFAEQADIPYRTLQNYILSGREPNAEALMKLHSRLGINLNWLISGNGEIFDETKNEKVADELDLISNFKNTSLIGQETILAIVKIISNKLNEK